MRRRLPELSSRPCWSCRSAAAAAAGGCCLRLPRGAASLWRSCSVVGLSTVMITVTCGCFSHREAQPRACVTAAGCTVGGCRRVGATPTASVPPFLPLLSTPLLYSLEISTGLHRVSVFLTFFVCLDVVVQIPRTSPPFITFVPGGAPPLAATARATVEPAMLPGWTGIQDWNPGAKRA